MAERRDDYRPLNSEGMSYPQQPGYNPNYNNPYPQGANLPPPPAPMPLFNNANIVENGEAGDGKYSFQFNDKTVRAAFVRKVFSLVFVMLLIVTAITAIPFLHEPLMLELRRSPALYFGGYAVFLLAYFPLVCCESVRRKFPINLILLGIFACATGVMTMAICAHHQIDTILYALGTCTICTLGIVIFASQTKFDLTRHVGVIFIISLVFMCFGFFLCLSLFFFHSKTVMLVYAFIGALLMMLYLFFHVQLLMGGKELELSPEDYIFAALQIFVDIVQLFWMLLSIFGSSK